MPGLGKTQFNDQLAHWTKEYTSQACYMCQLEGEYEPASLIHTLYTYPKAQKTIKYIFTELNQQNNIRPHEIILTNTRCTSNLGKNQMLIEHTMKVQI